MTSNIYATFTGTGSYLPGWSVGNDHFQDSTFLGSQAGKPTSEVIGKFEEITEINRRRWANSNQVTSDLAALAVDDLFFNTDVKPEDVDGLIVAHNFGDVATLGTNLDMVPTHASRVKRSLGIRNPYAIAYDIIASKGTATWVRNANGYVQNGKTLVIDPLDVQKSFDPVENHRLALEQLEQRDIDRETLEALVVAHTSQDLCLAEKLKRDLGLRDNLVAYDLIKGCPGALHALEHARKYVASGRLRKVIVVGAENLPKVSDPHDADSMIYSAGAGAIMVEAVRSDKPIGILSYVARTDAIDHADLLKMDRSFNPALEEKGLFLRMDGHEVFKYAVRTVPRVVKESIEKAGLSINKIDKVCLHQANGKMDKRILAKLFKAYGLKESDIPSDLMPMIIEWMGNNSVATVPILLDLINKGILEDELKSGDNVVLASVGAGMNINSMVYRVP